MLVQEEARLNSQSAHSIHFLSHQETQKNPKRKGERSKKKRLHNLNGSSKMFQRMNIGTLGARFVIKLDTQRKIA